ncbi:uncharacterized protein ARMOST_22322 [Armillaria ostoyae]|uniref:Cytochrome P450 n=1 Tax=Armillaria ostoyae TaxID=47428 RepID=A0A284SCJ5_ARMOS|nr:uncharacterized protein ARMOST_22322 [Armillaria ostoyae]
MFGFGRHICPGQYLALDTVWIAIASMMSTLSFSKAVDSEGQDIEPSESYTSGFVCLLIPFKCMIKAHLAVAQVLLVD